MLHATDQIGMRSLDQGVDVIGHPAVREHDPPAPENFVGKSLSEPHVVPVVVEQRIAFDCLRSNGVGGRRAFRASRIQAKSGMAVG